MIKAKNGRITSVKRWLADPRLKKAKGSILTYILALFVLTRLLYIGLGTMGVNIFKQELPVKTTTLVAVFSNHQPVQMWFVWDSQHYVKAAQGYGLSLDKLPVAGEKNGLKLYYLVHWFPVYPVTAKLLHTVTRISIPYSLLIVSNAAFITALYLLYKLLRVDEDDPFARSVLAVFFLLPASFIFSAALTESMFLLLSVAAIYSARKQRWWLAGLFGFLVAMTRSTGFLVALPLFVEGVQHYGWKRDMVTLKKYIRPVIAAGLTGLGLALFMFYGWVRTGDLFNYSHGSTVGWDVVFANPFVYIFHTIKTVRTLVILLELGLVAVFWKKLRWSYLAYTLVLAATALSVGITAGASSLRYTAPAFPIAIAIAYLMQKKPFTQPAWIALGIIHGTFFLLWAAWWTGFII